MTASKPSSKRVNFSIECVLAREIPILQRASTQGTFTKRTRTLLDASSREFRRRQNLVPAVPYQPDLPIRESLPKIVQALKARQVIVVAGETGSGKTTQLPLACIRAGLGVRGMIGHTQPRRLAARSVADRIAQQLNTTVGDTVGFAVRFEDKVSANTLVKVMTDGILLTEIQRDRNLYEYDTLIIDEAHERSLNIDFLLGYLKVLITKRPELRVIITSATIDVDAISKFFNNAPTFIVEGRSFPIDIRYRPFEADVEATLSACLAEIEAQPTNEIQDILMFLPGEREIFNWAHWFRKTYRGKYEVLPLYARLPNSEQRKIFTPSTQRRVLLATNVAETSLTVPNIRYVIDLGDARMSRFSLRSRIQQLPIERISQASANQRAGRCGRVAPGVCFRLYSKTDFDSRELYTVPQIKRTNLASVLLQMLVFEYGEIETFPFLDVPDHRAISAARRLLVELGALRNEQVTELGKQMVAIPVDPRLARMLIEAHKTHALKELLIIVSALSVPDPYLRPLEQQQAADQAHEQFCVPRSDFLSYLKLWDWIEKLRSELSWNEVRRRLERAFISVQRYVEWRALHRQLLVTCNRAGMKVNVQKASYKAIHQAILSGSLSFIGLRLEKSSYLGARGLKFWMFPGSVVVERKPKWVVAAGIVETSRVYARVLAEVQPKWIEAYATTVMSKRHHDHFWDPAKKDSRTYLDVSVHGLPIVQNRAVRLKDFDRQAARELFLLHALVRDEADLNVREISSNFELRDSLLKLQSRQRRSDIVVGEEIVAECYQERLPPTICDRASFLRWYRRAGDARRTALNIPKTELLHKPENTVSQDEYPPDLEIGSTKFALKYQFGPGHIDDGVSLVVPISDLRNVNSAQLDWIIPGFFEEKCLELFRGLPKSYRKQLAPIPDKIQELVPILLRPDQYRHGRLAEVLSQRINALYHVEIPFEAWSIEEVSLHLTMNVQVIDQNQKVVAQGRDLAKLSREVQHLIENHFDDSIKAKFEQTGLKTFPTSGLRRTMTAPSPQGAITIFPQLMDRHNCVDLRIQFDERGQYYNTIRGLSRLVLLRESDTVKYLTSLFNKDRSLQLYSINLENLAEFRELLFLTATRDTFFICPIWPETEEEFVELIATNREQFVPYALRLMDIVSEALAKRHRLYLRLETLDKSSLQQSRNDIGQQLKSLFCADFPYTFSTDRLPDLSRYLEGIEARLNRLTGKLQKDLTNTEEMSRWESRLTKLRNSLSDSQYDELFHLLQEYRLSLFCQEIKTRIKMSKKRLDEAFSRYEISL